MNEPEQPITEKKEAKYNYIAGLITAGYTKLQVVDKLRKQSSEMTKKKAMKLYDEAIDYINENSKKYVENLKAINIDRLTELYRSATDEDKIKDALTAVDLMNKTAGIYNNKLELETSGNITFTFGSTIEEEGESK